MDLLDALRRRAVAVALGEGGRPAETHSAEEGLRRLLRTYGEDEGLFLAWCAMRERMDRPDAQAESVERPTPVRERKTNS